jgi:hypothetical protein
MAPGSILASAHLHYGKKIKRHSATGRISDKRDFLTPLSGYCLTPSLVAASS